MWKGKVAVVTGANGAVGSQIVQALSEQGLTVIGLAKKQINYKEQCDGQVFSIECDLSEETQIIKAFKSIEKYFGGVDLMINNAVVSILSGLIDGKTDSWKKVFDINVMALNICNREALKTMRKRGDDGHIINVNSVAGHRVPNVPNIGIYAASKHAVTALSQSLRFDLRNDNSKIKVTNLCPGFVQTDAITNGHGDSDGEALRPKDVADAVLSIINYSPNVEVRLI